MCLGADCKDKQYLFVNHVVKRAPWLNLNQEAPMFIVQILVQATITPNLGTEGPV